MTGNLIKVDLSESKRYCSECILYKVWILISIIWHFGKMQNFMDDLFLQIGNKYSSSWYIQWILNIFNERIRESGELKHNYDGHGTVLWEMYSSILVQRAYYILRMFGIMVLEIMLFPSSRMGRKQKLMILILFCLSGCPKCGHFFKWKFMPSMEQQRK